MKPLWVRNCALGSGMPKICVPLMAKTEEELRALARLRLENPFDSLRELGEKLSPPLSRSGVNHRLEKIQELAARKD